MAILILDTDNGKEICVNEHGSFVADSIPDLVKWLAALHHEDIKIRKIDYASARWQLAIEEDKRLDEAFYRLYWKKTPNSHRINMMDFELLYNCGIGEWWS